MVSSLLPRNTEAKELVGRARCYASAATRSLLHSPLNRTARVYLSDVSFLRNNASLTMGHDAAVAAGTRHVLPLISAPQHAKVSALHHSPQQ